MKNSLYAAAKGALAALSQSAPGPACVALAKELLADCLAELPLSQVIRVRACLIVCRDHPEWGQWGVSADRGGYFELLGDSGGRVLDKAECDRDWMLVEPKRPEFAPLSALDACLEIMERVGEPAIQAGNHCEVEDWRAAVRAARSVLCVPAAASAYAGYRPNDRLDEVERELVGLVEGPRRDALEAEYRKLRREQHAAR